MRTPRKLALEAERALSRLWYATYGEKIAGRSLWAALGFKSRRAFDDAAKHQRLSVQLHKSFDRPGRFAWTKDVVRTLWDEIEKRRSGGKIQ